MMKKLQLSLMLLGNYALQAQNFVYDRFFNGGDNSTVTYGERPTEVIVQPDGKVISCGYSYDFGCNCYHIVMFRVDACGNTDSTFGTNGTVSYTFDQRNTANDFLMQANGKIVMLGTQAPSNWGSQQKPYIARFLNNGQPDTTFGTMGTTPLPSASFGEFTFVTEVANGKLLAQYGNWIMRFDSTGAVDLSFGTNGVINHAIPPGIAGQSTWRSIQRSDKKIISVCSAWFTFNNGQPLFMCTDTLGQLDSTFGTNGFYADLNLNSGSYSPFNVVLQSDDKIIAAHQNDIETEINVARYNTNGSVDTAYGTNGYVTYTSPSAPFRARDINVLSNNTLMVMSDASGIGHQINTIDTNGVITNSVAFFGNTTFNLSGSSDPHVLHVVNDNDFYIVSQTGGIGQWYISKLTTTPAPTVVQNVAVLSANYNLPGATYQWYLNGNIITGATDSIYTFTQNGLYSVQVITASGCDYTYNYTVTNTGIDDATSLNDITISPNPFNEVINISNSNQKNIAIKLTDVSGKIMETQNISQAQHQVKLNNLAAGVYLLTLQSGTEIKRIKLIKQ